MHQVLAAAMYIVTSVDSYRHSCTSQCMPNWPSCTCTFLYVMLYIHIGWVSFACGRAVQYGNHRLFCCCHPQSDGLGSTGWRRRVWPYTYPPWNTALLSCCSSEALVERMLSRFLDFFEKSSCHTSLTFTRLLVRSYKRTTNLSSTAIQSSVISFGDASRTLSTGVQFRKEPPRIPRRPLSTPIKKRHSLTSSYAWNIGKVKALSRPKDVPTACTGIFCTFFPDPWVTQTSSAWRMLTTEIASTTTSVSLLLILTRRWPREASRSWTKRVSASSWVQGARTPRSVLLVADRTLSPWVV